MNSVFASHGRRAAWFGIGVLSLVLVTAGCGSSPAKTAAPSTAQTTATSGGATTTADTGPVPKDDAAIVFDKPITKGEVDALVAEFRAVNLSEHKPFPRKGTAAYKTFQDDAVNYFVSGSALEQKAQQELGIVITESAVKRSLAQIRDHAFGGSQAKMTAHYKSLGVDEAQLEIFQRLQLAEDELPGILAARAHVKVTAAEAHAYYVSHEGHYSGSSFGQVEQSIVAAVRKQKTDTLVKAWIGRMSRSSCGQIRYQAGYHPSNLVCDAT
jgi:hypothetical protein